MRKTVLVVGLVVALPTCSSKNDPSAAPAPSPGSAAQRPLAPEPKRAPAATVLGEVRNYCAVAPIKRGADTITDNSIDLYVLLDGVSQGRPDQVYVSGRCRYHSGDEVGLHTNVFRPNAWECDFHSYYVSWPPKQRGHDVLGNKELEGWEGVKPQPIVEPKSEHVVRIDDFDVEGPGQLTVTCDEPPKEKILTSSCRVAWYNKFVPADVHFEGKCATAVMPKPAL